MIETCPLRKDCEIKNGEEVIERCKWFMPMYADKEEEWKCIMQWIPILLSEGSMKLSDINRSLI